MQPKQAAADLVAFEATHQNIGKATAAQHSNNPG